jgi:hypothetical protein
MRIYALLSVFLLAQAKPGVNVSFDEKVLAVVPEDAKVTEILFSPDGRQVAYKALKGGKVMIGVNKEKPAEYTSVDALRWSATGKLAYRASSGPSYMVVLGGQPGPCLAAVGMPVFSADGSKLGYEGSRGQGGAQDKGAWSVYIGGAKTGDYASCGPPAFSADGSVYAHSVRVGKPGTASRAFHTVHAMVIGGKLGAELEYVSSPVFAPKGTRYAHQQKEGMTISMNVDGKTQEGFSQIGMPVWSPDGTHLAYTAALDRKFYMVVDGKKGDDYLQVGDAVWSPDSKHLAHAATKGADSYVVVDGKPLEPFQAVETPTFSPDSTQIAYGAKSGPKWMMVMGDRRFDASYDQVGKPVWSPDGKKVAYTALWKYKQIIAVNDGKSEVFDAFGKEGPVWSPDSRNFAVAAMKEGKWWGVYGYRRDEALDEVSTAPYWSADGRKCAFGVRKGNELIWRVYKIPDDQDVNPSAPGKTTTAPGPGTPK